MIDMISGKRIRSFVLRMSEEEHKRLKLEAIERNMTVSSLIRQAIKIYIETYNANGVKK